MTLQFVNNLILEHLKCYGYPLEARILEREFNSKAPNPQTNKSKLYGEYIYLLQRGIGPREHEEDPSRYVYHDDEGNHRLIVQKFTGQDPISIKNRTYKKDLARMNTIKSTIKPLEQAYQSKKKSIGNEPQPKYHVYRILKDKRNIEALGLYEESSISHPTNENNQSYYNSLPHQKRDKIKSHQTDYKVPPINKQLKQPTYASRQTEIITSLNTRPAVINPSKGSYSANTSFDVAIHEQNPYSKLANKRSSVQRERPNNGDGWNPSTGYVKSLSPFSVKPHKKTSLTQNYNAFYSNPQRKGEPVQGLSNSKNEIRYGSHMSLVKNFMENDNKDNVLDDDSFDNNIGNYRNGPASNDSLHFSYSHALEPLDRVPRKMNQFGVSTKPYNEYQYTAPTKRHNDRLVPRRLDAPFRNDPYFDFVKEPSPFSRGGEALRDFGEEKRHLREKGQVDFNRTRQTHIQMNPKTLEYLLTNTFFNEGEIRFFFEVYSSIMSNATQPMNPKKFREFIHQTRNINGPNFTDSLFYFGPNLSFMATEGIIEFDEAVVILDRLNQDNPFSVMNFIFKLSAGEEKNEASLSLLHTILTELEPANMKGRISLLLESLEFASNHEKVRSVSDIFSIYLF